MQAAAGRMEPKLAGPSKLRKVSLNRLEGAISASLEKGKELSEVMNAVAGLTRVEYVFFYPESGDIVLAGPAEGFAEDAAGCVRGIFSGRPTIRLDDLLVSLRAFSPVGPQTNVISVSIDPTKEGLARMQQFLNQIGRNATRADTTRISRGLKDNLGLQTVTITGIPNDTHFARVLVEADYRMKLIGIGLEQLPLPFKSYTERSSPTAVARNSMERWYFVPNYDCVHVSEDGLAMRLVGDGVKLIGENERVSQGGDRVAGKVTNGASQAFCRDFTAQYPQIAAQVSVYAELKNLIDLSIAAAFIRHQDYYGQANWGMPVLGNEAVVPTRTHNAPYQVETAVNAIWRGSTLMTPLGGGIQMQPRLALRSDTLKQDDGQAANQRAIQELSKLAPDQWWWD
jgi:hypothetical protein